MVDDIPVGEERPRNADSLLVPDMVAIKRKLLHLGLERARRPAARRGERGMKAPARRRDLDFPRGPDGDRSLADLVPVTCRGGSRRADDRGLGHVQPDASDLADYWQGGFGVPSVAEGAPRSYLAAILSLARIRPIRSCGSISGLALGGVVGVALGLAVSWSRGAAPGRSAGAVPAHAAAACDGAAFQLWFGTYFFGQVLFVAYGVGVIVFAGR